MHLLDYVDEVLELCGIFDMAPIAPTASTSTVSTLHDRLQVGSLFLDDPISLRAMRPLHPGTPPSSLCVLKILKKFGAPFIAYGLVVSGSRGVLGWMRVVNSRPNFRRIFVRGEE